MLRIDDLEENTVDETVSEPVDETADDEAVLGGKKPSKKEKKPMTKKAKVVIAVVVVIVLAVAAVFGVVLAKSSSFKDYDKTIVTVDDTESNAAEFIQLFVYYKQMYSQYGQSIEDDQLKDDVLKQLEFVDVCYKRAVEMGMERDEADDEELKGIEEQLSTLAEEETVDEDTIVGNNYGRGFTKDIYVELVKKQQLANKYQQKLVDDIKAKFADGKMTKDIEADYNKDRKAYDLSNAQYCYIPEDNENAESEAKAIQEKVKNGATFASAVENSSSAKMGNGLVGMQYDILLQNFGEEITSWIFELKDGKYVNGKGATKVVTTNGSVYVIYVNDAPERDNRKPVTAYYGLASIGESDVKTKDELLAAAKSVAKKAFNEFSALKADEKTAEKFATLMTDTDGISADTFSDVEYNDTNLDPAIRDWLFDPARKSGDTTTIQTESGIYIVYYDSAAEYASWYTDIMNTQMQGEQQNITTEIEESIKDKVTVDEELVQKAIDFVNSTLFAQS